VRAEGVGVRGRGSGFGRVVSVTKGHPVFVRMW
jgi:hypothetical protein